jgi:hypothetical protein
MRNNKGYKFFKNNKNLITDLETDPEFLINLNRSFKKLNIYKRHLYNWWTYTFILVGNQFLINVDKISYIKDGFRRYHIYFYDTVPLVINKSMAPDLLDIIQKALTN